MISHHVDDVIIQALCSGLGGGWKGEVEVFSNWKTIFGGGDLGVFGKNSDKIIRHSPRGMPNYTGADPGGGGGLSESVGIEWLQKKIQVYTLIVASGKKTQFEILKSPGIDFYSGFRGNAQGGGGVQLEIPKM